MNELNDKDVKRAVYSTLCGGVFYFAAKRLKIDATAALLAGTMLGTILSTEIIIKTNDYV